jgi:hypothetical protein
MSREPLVLLGLPLEQRAVERPGLFFISCGLAFVLACLVLGALIDHGAI